MEGRALYLLTGHYVSVTTETLQLPLSTGEEPANGRLVWTVAQSGAAN